MNKTISFMLVGVGLLSSTFVNAADVKIYGRAHVSLDALDDGKDYNEVGLSSNASRLGFKVEHNLQENLQVLAQIEQEISFTSGDQDDKGVKFSSRDTYVGVKHDIYGQLRVGRFDSPFKAARGPVNLFGDMVGDLRNITRVGNLKFDERNDNTLEYKSAKFAQGFNVIGAISMNAGRDIAKDEHGKGQDDTNAYDIALTYKNDKIDAATAYERFDRNAANKSGDDSRDSFRIAASYKLIDALSIGAMYQIAQHGNDTVTPDVNVWGLTSEYKFAPKTAFRAEYFYRDVDKADSNASLIALGLEHKFDSTFRVYGNLATVLNDKNSSLNPWKEGRSFGNGVSGAKDHNASALSLGMRYDF